MKGESAMTWRGRFRRLPLLLSGIMFLLVPVAEGQTRCTGLWGYCDLQNSNTPQSVRIDSRTERIFAGMTISLDSLYRASGIQR